MAQRELPENKTDISVKSVSKDLRILRALKDCNRMEEHKDKVVKLKETYGSLQKVARESGMNLKNVTKLCKDSETFVKISTKIGPGTWRWFTLSLDRW